MYSAAKLEGAGRARGTSGRTPRGGGGRGEAPKDHKKILEKTVSLMTSKQMAAFKTDKEPKDGRDNYRITVKTGLKVITGFRLEALSGENRSGDC